MRSLIPQPFKKTTSMCQLYYTRKPVNPRPREQSYSNLDTKKKALLEDTPNLII